MATDIHHLEPQLLSDTQQHWEENTRQVMVQLQSQINLENMLQALVHQVASLLNADRCFIVEFDESKQPLPVRIEARSGESIASGQGLTVPWTLCPYLQRTENLQLAWSNDYLADEVVIANKTLYELAQQYQVRGLIACPIIANSELIFVLVLQTHFPVKWSQNEIFFVQALCQQAASSLLQIQVAQLNQQFRDHDMSYQALYEWEKKTREVLYTIRQSLNTNELFPMAIAEMARILKANRAFIIEFEGSKVCPIRYEYRSDDVVKPFTGLIPPWDFCPYLEKSAQQEMAWSADTFNDLAFAGNTQWHHFSRYYSIRSIVAAPIVYNEKLMNVVVFHSLEPRLWNVQELRFIEVLTDELSNIFYAEKVRLEHLRLAEFKNDFLSKVSHELRTPLNSILGYSKMLEREMAGPLNEKQAKYIHYVANGGDQLLHLINDLLDLSKIEAGKMTVYPESTDIVALMAEVKPMVEEQANTKDLSLSFQIQPDIGRVEVDPHRLKQILLNLLSNAIKFSRAGDSISVRLYIRDERLVGEVQDTGIGIPKQRLPELFHRFHQIDNSASRKNEGTGLGLILTKEFIELHGGEIKVESDAGVGTTFTFMLPVFSKVALPVPL